MAIILIAPQAMVFIGPGGYAPRGVGPLEYGPMLTALALALGLASRFQDWDRYGAPCTKYFALGALAATVFLPLALFGCLMALSAESATAAERSDELAFASNIAVASLLAALLIGFLGKLVGTLTWAVLCGGTFMFQAVGPTWQALLPFTVTITQNGLLDTRPRWAWIAALALLAVVSAWYRRSTPLLVLVRQ